MTDDFPRWRPGWAAHFSHLEPDWRRRVWLRPNPRLGYHEGRNAYALTIDGYELAQERWGSFEVDEMFSQREEIARTGFAADFIDLARGRCRGRRWDLPDGGSFEGFLTAPDRTWDRKAEGHWLERPGLLRHEPSKSRVGE